MKIEILMSCMDQTDDTLIRKTGITGDAVVVNQCNRQGEEDYPTDHGLARMLHSRDRGLTKSRNLALEASEAEVCMLCDDDEVLFPDYEDRIRRAYREIPGADVMVFRVKNWPSAFGDKPCRLRFPGTMKVSSIQLSFRRERLLQAGVRFDELLGAGSGNGAEEELKFLTDCEKAGLRIYYFPLEVASLETGESTWFGGFHEQFFRDRGGTTRYILGLPLASAYAVYYVIKKRSLYRGQISSRAALRAIFQGILEDKVSKQARS